MKQSPSSGTSRSSNNQEISHIFRNPRVHYCVHNNLPMVTILSQVNQEHTLPTCFIYNPLYYHLPIYNLISETVFISFLSSTTVLTFVYILIVDIMSTRLISQTRELRVCPQSSNDKQHNDGGRMNINYCSRVHPYIWFCSLQLICKSGFQDSSTSHFEAVPTLRHSLQSSSELTR